MCIILVVLLLHPMQGLQAESLHLGGLPPPFPCMGCSPSNATAQTPFGVSFPESGRGKASQKVVLLPSHARGAEAP